MDVDGEDWEEDDGGAGGDGQAGVHTDGGHGQEIKVRRQPHVINIIYTNPLVTRRHICAGKKEKIPVHLVLPQFYS